MVARHHLGDFGQNFWRRLLCNAFGLGGRFSLAALHKHYAMICRQEMPLQRETAGRIADYLDQLTADGFLTPSPGPRGGKGWRIEPACAPAWILEFRGGRLRRAGRYVCRNVVPGTVVPGAGEPGALPSEPEVPS